MKSYKIEIDSGFGSDYTLLEWTAENPTREGWYWIFGKNLPRRYCVYYKRYITQPPYEESLKEYFDIDDHIVDGYQISLEYASDEITNWLGPLPEPEAPNETGK